VGARALRTLAVAVYGGYFGAGMSIVNLAKLGILGMTDLLEMNALTSLFSLAVNGVAIALFAAGLVRWPVAQAMAMAPALCWAATGRPGWRAASGAGSWGGSWSRSGFTVSAIFFARRVL
jgi:uncharacterized membrane protein YfcA